jgi:hypothetical protein
MTRMRRPGREALGRSRGGLSTKIHLAADRRCRPVARILSPGQHGDCPRFIPLMRAIRIRFTSTEVVYGVADPDVTRLPEYGVVIGQRARGGRSARSG